MTRWWVLAFISVRETSFKEGSPSDFRGLGLQFLQCISAKRLHLGNTLEAFPLSTPALWPSVCQDLSGSLQRLGNHEQLSGFAGELPV